MMMFLFCEAEFAYLVIQSFTRADYRCLSAQNKLSFTWDIKETNSFPNCSLGMNIALSICEQFVSANLEVSKTLSGELNISLVLPTVSTTLHFPSIILSKLIDVSVSVDEWSLGQAVHILDSSKGYSLGQH